MGTSVPNSSLTVCWIWRRMLTRPSVLMACTQKSPISIRQMLQVPHEHANLETVKLAVERARYSYTWVPVPEGPVCSCNPRCAIPPLAAPGFIPDALAT